MKEHDPNSITPADLDLLIDELISRPVLADACDGLGLSLLAVKRRQLADKDFNELIEAALAAGADRLEARAYQRGMGEDKSIKMFNGKPVTRVNPDTGETEYIYEVEQSDRILAMMLKARKPELFGDKAEITHNAGTGNLVIPAVDGAAMFEDMLRKIKEEAAAEEEGFKHGKSSLDATAGKPNTLPQ